MTASLLASIRKRFWICAAVFLAASATVAMAHHGVADYDMTKLITLKGSVAGFQWSNPHAMIELDAKDAKGAVEKWQVESNSPNLLARAGWTRNSLKPGDLITVTGYAAKNGSKLLRLEKVILAGGRVLSPGS